MISDNTASYTPDFAAAIDSEEEIIADEFGVSLKQARRIIKLRDDAIRREQAMMLAGIIGALTESKNLPVMVHALAVAFGFDEMNGWHSESEIASKLGCSRALISHYVVGWRDVLAGKSGAFDCTKFRKHNSTRETYKEKATDPLVQAKKRILQQQAKEMKSYLITSENEDESNQPENDKLKLVSSGPKTYIVQAKDEDNAKNQAEKDGIKIKTIILA